jgi:hypothetical protein
MKAVSVKLTVFSLFSVIISLMVVIQGDAAVDLEAARVIFLFDEGSGNMANDHSGNGNDGKLVNKPKWVAGKYGKALEFNGANNYVEVETPHELPIGAAPRTICFWFKWSKVAWPDALHEMMGYGRNNPGQRLGLGLLETAWHSLGIETVLFARNFEWDADTKWHHFAAAYPEGEKTTDKFKIYLDGVLHEAENRHPVQNLNTAEAPLVIGCLPDPKLHHFPGRIDEVAIFSEELSADDINAIAKRGLLGAQAVSALGNLAISWGGIKTQ